MGSTATVAVLFCDWVASTERQTRLGDIAADDLRRRLFSVLRGCAADTDGTVVKNTGDGCMVVFERSTIDAIECARLMHQRVVAIEPTDPVHLRIGVSAGEAAYEPEDRDWYGLPVVEAARLCDKAAQDQTLAPALVMALVGSRGAGHTFRQAGTLSLKGFPHTVEVVEVDGTPDGSGAADSVSGGAAVIGGAAGAGTAATALGPSIGAGVPASSTARSGSRFGRDSTRRTAASGAQDHQEKSSRHWLGGRSPRAVAGAGVLIAALLVAGVARLIRDDGTGSVDASSDGAEAEPGVQDSPDYTPTFAEAECGPDVAGSIPDAECGELSVPVDRDDPEGDQLELPVTRVPATESEADPVVLLDINEPIVRSPLRGAAEVISLGIRGLNAGTYRCEDMADEFATQLAASPDDQGALKAKGNAAAACAQEARDEGIDLAAYNLHEVALDLRDLLVALDLERVTVAAGGYATPAVVSFARANPGAVGALALTNPVPPGESILESPAVSLSKQWKRLVELCAKDKACRAAYPDLDDRYTRTWQSFEDWPIRVTTTALNDDGPFDILLNGRRVAAATEAALQNAQQAGLLPGALGGASNELMAAVSINEDLGTYIGSKTNNATLLGLLCSYDAELARISGGIPDAGGARFAGANDPAFVKVCTEMEVPSVFESLSHPLDVDVPVFIAEGGLFVGGVNGWGEQLASLLEEATVLTFPTRSAELAYAPPPCLRELRNEFVVDPGPVEGGEECEKQSEPIEFVAPS